MRACAESDSFRKLQWGRATEGPERALAEMTPLRKPRLQWGRATEGPESPAAQRLSVQLTHGFNGAGPRRARRETTPAPALGAVSKLQWGRATEGPESTPKGGPSASTESFNGAGPRRARRDEVNENGRTAIDSFNGAGPRRARRATIEQTWPTRASASMGPGHGGPGEPAVSNVQNQVHARLQWGRATEGPEREEEGGANCTHCCFNGAGPRRARRDLTGRPIFARIIRFNGAGPRRARRALRALGPPTRVGQASMGPGHGGPGEPRPLRIGQGPASLGFNGAGPRRARRALCSNRRRNSSSGFNGAGPRRARREESLCWHSQSRSSFNGAGPRRARRVIPRRYHKTMTGKLQWGRATEGPERVETTFHCPQGLFASMGPGHGGPGELITNLYPVPNAGLQWGRATEGPESRRAGGEGGPVVRFNGAGPRRARRASR